MDDSGSGFHILKKKEMADAVDMDREEMEKALEKAKRDWQARLDQMTPEERAQAQEKAVAAAEADWAAIEQLTARAKSILAGSAPAEKPKPKFCTNCGAPVSGGKFCTNCGSPL
jgi:rubrerythrin